MPDTTEPHVDHPQHGRPSGAPTDDRHLTRRLDRLERSARRWRLGAMASTLALSTLLLAGSVREEVSAERFILQKAADAGSAEISFDGDNMPRILLKDREGRTRLNMALDVGGRPAVNLRDKNEKTRASMKLTGFDEPSVACYDARGRELKQGNAAPAAGDKKGTASKMDGRPRVAIETSLGKIVVELRPDKAPITVKNFLRYTDEKFYDGTIFHRVISNFMIQGGGFDKSKNEKSTHPPIKLEVRKGLSNVRGTIAMARTQFPDSATAQFFINVVDNVGLDSTGGGYAVFGEVVEGMEEVVDKIKSVRISNQGMAFTHCPTETVEIISVRRVGQ